MKTCSGAQLRWAHLSLGTGGGRVQSWQLRGARPPWSWRGFLEPSLSSRLHLCCRYIRSERSVILINFCLSIISSNALILIGQTQTWNKVGGLRQEVVQLLLQATPPHLLSSSALSGLVHRDCCLPSFLLPVLLLLGSDGGLAVLHGGDGTSPEPHHPQAFPVSWLGWAFLLLAPSALPAHLLLGNLHLLLRRSSCAGGRHLGGIHKG